CLLLARKTFQPTFPMEYYTALIEAVHQRSGWKRVLEIAYNADIYPLLFQHLSRLNAKEIQEEVLWGLKTFTLSNEKRCLSLQKELFGLLDFLQRQGLRVLPLRGVILSQELYGGPTLRVVRDIDLLVPRGEAVRALRLLRELGYKLEVDDAFFERFILPVNHAIIMVRESQGGSFPVDLHWELVFPPFGVPPLPQVFWEEGVEGAYCNTPLLSGRKVLSTRPEWTLLFLALHVYHHRFARVNDLADLNELSLRREIAWDVVEEVAGRYGWTEVIQLALTVCHRLFGTEVPKTFRLDELPSWAVFFPSTNRDHPFRGPKRLHCLWHTLFWPTQTDYQFLPLPLPIRSLYFLIRPIRGGVAVVYRAITTRLRAFFQLLF
ncbi:MAG TPA: nucleotidyltransferase domain-containing protein, partial [Candidatus Hypogeohydataceae bacterium YC38]